MTDLGARMYAFRGVSCSKEGWAKLKRVEELWKELRGLVGSEEG
jgi:hypothetical protein